MIDDGRRRRRGSSSRSAAGCPSTSPSSRPSTGTPCRRSTGDKDGLLGRLWDSDDVFYSTVAGFKGLERPAVVLVVDGFHDDLDPRNVLYTGMSRARDLLIVVGDPADLEPVVGEKLMRRLRRGAVSLPAGD